MYVASTKLLNFTFANYLFLFYRIKVEESKEYWKSANNQSIGTNSKILPKGNILSVTSYMYIYSVLVFSLFFIGIVRSISFYTMCIKNSQALHDIVFNALIQTSMRFFDVNPSGRILNRFSKDMRGVDELLPKATLDAAQNILQMIGIFVVACVVNPLFLIPIAVLTVIFWWIRKIYLKTSKNIRRLEGISQFSIHQININCTLLFYKFQLVLRYLPI